MQALLIYAEFAGKFLLIRDDSREKCARKFAKLKKSNDAEVFVACFVHDMDILGSVTEAENIFCGLAAYHETTHELSLAVLVFANTLAEADHLLETYEKFTRDRAHLAETNFDNAAEDRERLIAEKLRNLPASEYLLTVDGSSMGGDCICGAYGELSPNLVCIVRSIL